MAGHIETGAQLLIVGAGPTGLTLAIEFQRRRIDSLIVERNDSTVFITEWTPHRRTGSVVHCMKF